MRRLLFEELAGADRVVLLGDVVELRDQPLGSALARVRPFFEELGAALGEREVRIVPGNHDHRLAEPLLDARSLNGGGRLGLEQEHAPTAGPTGLIAEWLGDANLRIAYPGLWLREDVYATHGHYMDAHLTLPRAECVAAAAMIRRAGPLPDRAAPADYERVFRPLYGFAFGAAQARSLPTSRVRRGPSESAWRLLSGNESGAGLGTKLRGRATRAAFPPGIRALNRLLRSHFEADISPAAIFAGGVGAGGRAGGPPRRRRRPRDHRPHPPRRPQRRRSRVGAAARRPPAQHRQLGLRLRLPPPGDAAQPLLAGDGDLGRGERSAAPRAATAGALACRHDRPGWARAAGPGMTRRSLPAVAPPSHPRTCPLSPATRR